MKAIQWIMGLTGAVALTIVLLITSFEIAAYSNYGFYQKEYEKYDVLADVQMEMEDVMDVTREMMAYLRGNRDDLVVDTVVDGQSREFFNQREKDHMEDVMYLFIGGLRLRIILAVLAASCFAGLVFMKKDWKKIIPRAYQIGVGIFFGIGIALTLLISTDFTKYFTIFHEIFFTNDLWLLDPRTDLLINILPEGFFVDMAIRIGLIFVVILLVTLGGSIFWSKKNKKN